MGNLVHRGGGHYRDSLNDQPTVAHLNPDQFRDLMTRGLNRDLGLVPFQMPRQPDTNWSALLAEKPRPTVILHNMVNIHTKSLQLQRVGSTCQYTVAFRFDALLPCNISIRFLEGRVSKPFTYTAGAGLDQAFAQPTHHTLDLSAYELVPDEDEAGKNKPCPLVIVLEALKDREDEKQVEQGGKVYTISNLCTIVKKPGDPSCSASVSEQRVVIDKRNYELQEVYGIREDAGETTSEECVCVVCTVNPRTVTIFPCRHTYLCSECIEILRAQTNRCPICRCAVESAVDLSIAQACFASPELAALPIARSNSTVTITVGPESSVSSSSATAPPVLATAAPLEAPTLPVIHPPASALPDGSQAEPFTLVQHASVPVAQPDEPLPLYALNMGLTRPAARSNAGPVDLLSSSAQIEGASERAEIKSDGMHLDAAVELSSVQPTAGMSHVALAVDPLATSVPPSSSVGSFDAPAASFYALPDPAFPAAADPSPFESQSVSSSVSPFSAQDSVFGTIVPAGESSAQPDNPFTAFSASSSADVFSAPSPAVSVDVFSSSSPAVSADVFSSSATNPSLSADVFSTSAPSANVFATPSTSVPEDSTSSSLVAPDPSPVDEPRRSQNASSSSESPEFQPAT